MPSRTITRGTGTRTVRAGPPSSSAVSSRAAVRPNSNTSWEAAKFEACNHRFVHFGEPGWGVAVVSDSTYGHDVPRTVRTDGDRGTTTTVRRPLGEGSAVEREGDRIAVRLRSFELVTLRLRRA